MMSRWEYCEVSIWGGELTILFFLPTGESKQTAKPSHGEQLDSVLAKTMSELGLAGWEAYSVIERYSWHFKRMLPE